jgi:hypothetical protein
MSAGHALISPKAVDRLQAGHLWIYRSDVLACEADPGSIVIVNKKGRIYGRAFCSTR